MTTELFVVKNFTVAVTPHKADIIDARVIINAGAAKEDADSFGSAHFLEHLFFKGTTRHSYEQINRMAARLGNINAHTDHHTTAYLLQFLPNGLEEATRLLLELVFEPAFPEEEFIKEKGVIIEECQSALDQPTHYFFDQITWHLLGDEHGHPIIGTMDSIKSMTIEKLRRFVGAHYHPANILISFVGPITRNDIETLLQECLPDIPAGEKEPWWTDTLRLDRFDFHHQSKQAITALVSSGVTLQGEMDYNYLPDVFCNALGGGMHSLLFDRLREQLGLCYHVGAYHSSGATIGNLAVYSLLDENNVEQAHDEIRKIIAKIKANGIDEELLEIVKRNYLFGFAKQQLTPMGIARMIEVYFDLNVNSLNPYINFQNRADRVSKLTNKDVINFANFIFDDSKPQGVVTMTQTPEKKEKKRKPSPVRNDDFRLEWD